MQTAIELRDVQTEALDALVASYRGGQRRILGVAPTGFGKTILFSHVRGYLGFPPGAKVLILVHRDELALQAVEKYQRCEPGTIFGIEKAQAKAGPFDAVVVASVQTLTREARLTEFRQRWGDPDIVITDEAHHAISPSYTKIYDALGITPTGRILHIGVTATPRRGDNVGLEGVFDVIAFSYSIADIIERGYLVPLVGYRLETDTNLDKVRTTAGDFNERDLADAVDNPIRNARVVAAYRDIMVANGLTKALVFAASVAHSMNLTEMFVRAGYRAVHIDGTTPLEERRAILAGYSRGEYDVICNCAVLTEGYDEPSIQGVIIARPTKSGVLYTQMAGRGTRLFEGKTKCVIIDIVDVTKRHSVVQLASLLGLPADFDLKGRSVTSARKQYEKMVKESPLAAMLVHDAAKLEDLDRVAAEQRLAFLVKELLDGAKRSQKYVPVNLLKTPPLPREAAAATMAWMVVGEDRYMLQIEDQGKESLTVAVDPLGHFVLERRNGVAEKLGTFPALDAALRAGESWVRANRPQRVNLLVANTWRTQPASDKQLAALRKFRIQCPPGMTKGEASNALDIVMAAVARGDHRK